MSLHLHPSLGLCKEVRTLSAPEPLGAIVGHIPQELVDVELTAWLYETFGVGDLEGLEDAHGRTVELSPASTVVCPMHGRQLKPDACRSCSFLAGDQSRKPATGK
jgi:hypothetical protein